MNIPSILSGLHKSTKVTIIACACFLALTGLVLLFLMMFPIEPEHSVSLQNSVPEETTETVEMQSSFEEEQQNTEAPHTLSTWSASVEGYSRSSDEYYQYIRSTTTRDEEAWETTIMTETDESETTEMESISESMTGEWEETDTSYFEETGFSEMESSEYIHSESQTVTETVVIPTEPEETAAVETEPQQTDAPPIVIPDLPEETDFHSMEQ